MTLEEDIKHYILHGCKIQYDERESTIYFWRGHGAYIWLDLMTREMLTSMSLEIPWVERYFVTTEFFRDAVARVVEDITKVKITRSH